MQAMHFPLPYLIGKSASKTLKLIGGEPTLLHLHSGLTAQSVINDKIWTFIHKSQS
jgi:hypothetical protein